MVMLLEGGYNISQVARSVSQCVKSLLATDGATLAAIIPHATLVAQRDQKDADDMKAEAAAKAAAGGSDGFMVATKKSVRTEITRRKEREALFAVELDKVVKQQRVYACHDHPLSPSYAIS